MAASRILFVTILLSGAVFPSRGVLADFSGPGVQDATSVEAVSGFADGRRVVLDGHIVGEIEPHFYRFRDASGEVRVEIDEEIWRGRSAVPGDKVRIHGEVDQSRLETEIDASHLEIFSADDQAASR